jgi:molybdopterin molybdotransferase
MIAINESPRPGQIRDVNRYTLGALCERCGAQPVFLGLCPDEFEALRSLVELGLDRADTVWISGGSSVGTRDLTLRVLETFRDFELLVHGIAISPGKPTIIGRAGDRPVIGLPGHVASAMVVAEVFLKRLIWRLSGRTNAGEWGQTTCNALLSRNIESKSGREDYVRVRLIEDGERLTAEPIFGKSGLISPLVEAQGLVRVDLNMEGLYQGQVVKVMLFDNEPAALNRVQ